MYECPASIAPEPNNYEFISSRSIFFFWLAEQRIHSCPGSAQPAGIFSVKSSDSTRRHKSHCTWFSMLFWPQWLLYLFTAAFVECLPSLCSSLCVNPAQKRKADGSPPLPDGCWQATKTESSLSQSARRKFKHSWKWPIGARERRGRRWAANTIKAFSGGFLEWQRACPNGYSSVSIVKCTWC